MTQENKPIDLSQFEGHTPRPWKVGYRKDGTAWISRGSIDLHWHNQSDFAGNEADARLTEAAPDLVVELRTARAKIKELEEKIAHMEAAESRVAQAMCEALNTGNGSYRP